MNPETLKIRLEDEFRKALWNIVKKYPLKECIVERVSTPQRNFDEHFVECIKHGLELKRNQYQNLFKIIDSVTDALHISPKLHVFKMKDIGNENASMISYQENAILSFDNDILKLIGNHPNQLKSIIGHELGHYIYKHTEDSISLYVNNLASFDEKRDPPLNKDELKFMDKEGDRIFDLVYLISQLEELNADRVGLLACMDFEASAVSEIKLTGGYFDNYGTYTANDFLDQAYSLLKIKNYFTAQDLYLTHPLPILRVLALKHFHDSTMLFHSNSSKNAPQKLKSGIHNKNKRQYSEEDILFKVLPLNVFFANPKNKPLSKCLTMSDEQLYGHIELETVKPNEELENHEEFMKDSFTFFAILYVITSVDGKISRAENRYLLRCIRNKKNLQKILEFNQNVDDDEVEAKYLELVPFAKKLPSRSKTALLKNLINAAKADRRIDNQEIEMILWIAEEIDAMKHAKVQLDAILGIKV